MSLPVIYSLPVVLLASCLCLVCEVSGQEAVYLSSGQAQSTKMAPMVYYKPKEPPPPKVTTVEPSTEPSGQQQYYSMAENYYQDYKGPTNGPQKYALADYGAPSSEAPSVHTDYAANTTPAPPPPPPRDPGDIQGHLENLLKLLLTSKVSSPKFLLLLPFTGKGAAYAKPDPPPTSTTVKPKPRKKTKYIVVN